MNRITRPILLTFGIVRFLLAAVALLATLIVGSGCGESPVDNDPTSNNTQQNGTPSGGANSFVVDGDGYSATRFLPTGYLGSVSYGSTLITISAVYNGQPASLGISLESAAPGTYRLSGTNFISMTITKGFSRYYSSGYGTVTITDIGSESGTIKGSFTATLLRGDTGAEVTVSGNLSIPRQ